MSASASTRISIRWPPEQASEPTDTLVLVVGDYYVDLRISKADGSIDWALAEQRLVLSQEPLKVKFTHTIDSHGLPECGIDEPDVGEFSKLPNGDDLETGIMAARHLNGKLSSYEEIWRDLDSTSPNRDTSRDDNASWILESSDHEAEAKGVASQSKTFYARIGKFFLGIRAIQVRSSSAQQISAIRQVFDEDLGRWVPVYAVGDCRGMSLISDSQAVPETRSINQQVVISTGSQDEVFLVKALA